MSENQKPSLSMEPPLPEKADAPLVLTGDERAEPEASIEAEPIPFEPSPAEVTSIDAPAELDPVILPPPEPKPQKPKSGGFFPALLGGALVCAAGFAASHFNLFNLRTQPEIIAPDLSAIESRLNALDQALAKPAAPSEDLAGLSEQIIALEQKLAALPKADNAAEMEALRQELASVKASQPSGLSEAQLREIIEGEINARAEAASAKAAAEAAAEIEAAKAKALREAALFTLQEAKSTGLPFAAALATLGVNPPELTAFAENGLPRLDALQDSFPEVARTALEASLRADAGAGVSDRIWSFLRIQSGARSLTPQEGSDPDAVLSRAEAALRAGDLAKTIEEITTLPAQGQTAFADWLKLAQDRLAGLAAIDAISAQ